MYKKILKFWKEEKSFLILVCFVLFLSFNLVRAINTINELKEQIEIFENESDYQATFNPDTDKYVVEIEEEENI